MDFLLMILGLAAIVLASISMGIIGSLILKFDSIGRNKDQ